ncbi:MAG: mannosyltransferase [Flavobacteriaceae bacterium]|nr:mannosyltransferase [Flavobacteriaceae bacterium]
MSFIKENSIKYLVIVTTIILYFLFAYQLERTQFVNLLVLYACLFASYFYLLKKNNNEFKFLVGIAVLYRLVFLFAIPNLSQDFYRFIWDGRLIFEGLNPYLYLPEDFINQQQFPVNQAQELYTSMGALNGSHFTNYPPINQLCFFIAAVLANKSIMGAVIVMRLLIIFADIGIIYFGKKILTQLKLPTGAIFLYALNPFIIIELTGNLHFEPVMLFFLVWSIYLLLKKQQLWAAAVFALSISVKLIPLLFLPLFFQWFVKNEHAFKKGIATLAAFYGVVLAVTLLLFLPFYTPELIANYSNSVGLWFRNFEFNASFYYIFREIGYVFRGYNEIAIIGKIMPAMTILFLGWITLFRKNKQPKQLLTAMLFGISFYYFTTTTMHPWYLATLILLTTFTRYRFPIIWSVAIVLSYQAYANTPWQENLWLVAIEYVIMYSFLIWEITNKKRSILLL